jgi:glycerophosphoryl diester phosphodiesterase
MMPFEGTVNAAVATLCLSYCLLADAQLVMTDTEVIALGSRPFELVRQLRPGPLKEALSRCASQRDIYQRTDFSIGHRGAALHYPEHTMESYVAAATQGAGIVECDVTFTKDRELVCRHDQCGLHSTTNIVETPLAQKCTVPPKFDVSGNVSNAESIQCCTSDLTLKEFKLLQGTMRGADASRKGRGTLVSHAESIELFQRLGVGMAPELKIPEVAMPFEGSYTQESFAQQMIDEYVAAGIAPGRVWPQSFSYADVLYWIHNTPAFGDQAVMLDSREVAGSNDAQAVAMLDPSMAQFARDGLHFLAVDKSGAIIPSAYARSARTAGLNLIGWTTERSGELNNGGGGYYYSTVQDAIEDDGDILTVIDVLAQEVGVVGLFSDWPATTTFYGNCRPIAKPAVVPTLPSKQAAAGRVWED